MLTFWPRDGCANTIKRKTVVRIRNSVRNLENVAVYCYIVSVGRIVRTQSYAGRVGETLDHDRGTVRFARRII